MALQEFTRFYRQNGLRRVQSLATPPLVALHELPRNALWHYLSLDTTIPYLDPTRPFLGSYLRKRIAVYHPESMARTEGVVSQVRTSLRGHTNKWFLKNKNFLFVPDYTAIKDPTQLVVINYSHLNEMAKYSENVQRFQNEYLNATGALFDGIADALAKTDRVQIVEWALPSQLLSFTTMEKLATTPWSALHRTNLGTVEAMNLYQLWLWLDPVTRSQSLFDKIPREHYTRVELLLPATDGRHAVLSLAYLNSWMLGQPNQTEFPSIRALEPKILRKFFYGLFMSLVNAAEGVVDETLVRTVEETEVGETEVETPPNNPQREDDITPIANAVAAADSFEALVADLETNIDEMDAIAQSTPVDSDDDDTVDNFAEVEAELRGEISDADLMRRRLDDYATARNLPATQYRQLLKEIEASNELPEPYGSGRTRREMGAVTAEDVKIKPEDCELNVPKVLVPDESMHTSTLKSLNRRYIQEVLPRDVVRMVSAVQRGGVVVRSHEIESVKDIQGAYEIHTINLRPVEGNPSPLRFKIPKLNPDGTYESGGNQYFLRHQRYDAPIRKIDGRTVQLASYYGKTQVSLSDKAVDSVDRWIITKLQTYALGEPGHVRDFVPGEAYDPEFRAPTLYSTLAGAFLSFRVQRNTLMFDHTKREELAAKLEIDLSKIERQGRVLCGHTASKEPIAMTSDNQFVVIGADGEKSLGDAYSLFQLDPTKAPLELAQIRVGRQQIPIGVLIGYYFGWTSLLKLIKAKYRTIPTGKRTEIGPYEYRIRFSDTTYIFDRRDTYVSMIMAGFLKYERNLKAYSAKDMRNPGTYISIMQSAGGVSAAAIRDMTDMRTMFVDPITADILTGMREPTQFPGLVLRACEMLTYRHHPKSQDTAVQRLRGAERIAGEIYTQLVKQIKQYRASSRSGRIEMSPWQVWTAISSDQSGKITEMINPVQYLKQGESVTYVGNGGRDKSSINKATRAMHISDVGLMSEAGVDSGDVGVNTFLCINPKIESLYGGISKEPPSRKINPLSTSLALAPFGDRDDMLTCPLYG